MPALESLAERTRETDGLDVSLALVLPPLDPEVETTVYRLVQEALTNAGKHADATLVRVEAHVRSGQVAVTVTDDGGGFDPQALTAGFGLAGMRERAELAGGSLEVASGPDGTSVCATVPAGGEPPAGDPPTDLPA